MRDLWYRYYRLHYLKNNYTPPPSSLKFFMSMPCEAISDRPVARNLLSYLIIKRM